MEAAFDYLMLSDVHLGSDIVPHSRPWATSSWLMHDAEVDARLASFLDHHRRERPAERRWKLVIAGDFLDLVGVSIPTSDGALRTPPTDEEHRHGIGSAPDHVAHKVRVIAKRHARVFRALHDFVLDGNALVLVRGNHDVELHWRAAQRAFVDAVTCFSSDSSVQRELAARIEICPWFFWVPGVVYVEHGHEFDAMCSYGDPLMPTCVRDPRRIRSTPFSVLLRHVARPTKGLSTGSYGYVGMGAYMTLLANLGLVGTAQIGVRFARASWRLVSECFARASSEAREHTRRLFGRVRLARFAEQAGVNEKTLQALRGLYVPPASASVSFVVRSLYIDRMLTGAVTALCGLVALLSFLYWGLPQAIASALIALLLGVYTIVGNGRNTAPTAHMKRGAAQISKLFGARWIVMGHTHEPAFDRVRSDAVYVNLGSWGADELPDERSAHTQESSTFLVVRGGQGEYQAELMRWDAGHGRAEPAFAPEDAVGTLEPFTVSLSPAE